MVTSRCHLCEADVETADHIFVKCHFSKYLWFFLADSFKRHLDFSGNFETLFIKAMKEKFSSHVQALWHAGIIFICWLIWKTRNEITFEGKKLSLPSLKAWIVAHLRDTNRIILGYIRNNIEEFIILHDLGIKGKTARGPSIIPVFGTLPFPGG